jgi:N-acyl-D-aspartate/D-glutamate deacylase
MSYDLVIKNGKIIDGSGLPAFTATSLSAAPDRRDWDE